MWLDLPSKRRNTAYVELSITSLNTKDTTIAILIPNSFLIKSILPEIPETPTEKKKKNLRYFKGKLSDFWKESYFFL